MERRERAPRPDWQRRVEEVGFPIHTADAPYWDESAFWVFTPGDVDLLERATAELHEMVLAAVGHVIETGRYWERLAIPREMVPLIARSWEGVDGDGDPSIYGRMDLAWDGVSAPRLLEYNADTPTGLVEAVGGPVALAAGRGPGRRPVELAPRAAGGGLEGARALAAGGAAPLREPRRGRRTCSPRPTSRTPPPRPGCAPPSWRCGPSAGTSGSGAFVDGDGAEMRACFKLYPWEWMAREHFGAMLPRAHTRWIEPAWKMVASNKGILAVLWELYPDHPNLLPAFLEPGDMPSYARKPLLSREGANVVLVRDGEVIAEGAGRRLRQGGARLAGALGAFRPHARQALSIGSWLVRGVPAGAGLRESDGPITGQPLPLRPPPDLPRTRAAIPAAGPLPGHRRRALEPRASPWTSPRGAAGRSAPRWSEGGVNFSIWSRHATAVELCLFDAAEDARPSPVIRLDPAPHRTYHYWHAHVAGLAPGQLYGWRVHGPFDPARGYRFDGQKLLVDPYGRAPGRAHPPTTGWPAPGAATTPGKAMKSVVADLSRYDWEGDRPLRRHSPHAVIYEMHVKGLHLPRELAAWPPARRGTFAGVVEKIPHLRDLGVTAVELMPVFQFDPQDAPTAGSSTTGATPRSPSSRPTWPTPPSGTPLGALDEFRDLVKALHRADIEVILDVVFNHTAEGDEKGPTQSFRGLDNRAYYILDGLPAATPTSPAVETRSRPTTRWCAGSCSTRCATGSRRCTWTGSASTWPRCSPATPTGTR